MGKHKARERLWHARNSTFIPMYINYETEITLLHRHTQTCGSSTRMVGYMHTYTHDLCTCFWGQTPFSVKDQKYNLQASKENILTKLWSLVLHPLGDFALNTWVGDIYRQNCDLWLKKHLRKMIKVFALCMTYFLQLHKIVLIAATFFHTGSLYQTH